MKRDGAHRSQLASDPSAISSLASHGSYSESWRLSMLISEDTSNGDWARKTARKLASVSPLVPALEAQSYADGPKAPIDG